MYDFSKYLEKDEKILYTCEAVPGKGSKENGAMVVAILIVLALEISIAWGLLYEPKSIKLEIAVTIAFFIPLILLQILCVKQIVYVNFKKDKELAGVSYCITTARAMRYDAKKDNLTCGYLDHYDTFEILCEKNGYGDIFMAIDLSAQASSDVTESKARKAIKILKKANNPKNRTNIKFESIKQPEEVIKIAKKAKKEFTGIAPDDFVIVLKNEGK